MNVTGAPELLERDLRSVIERVATSTDGAACVVAFDAPRHSIAMRLAAGRLARGDNRPATPTTPFRIASITKPFTAVVIMQLASEGRLHLDDPAIDVLPGDLHELVDRLHVVEGTSYGRQITIRHLLTHASGLFDHATSGPFFSAIVADPSRPWSPRELLEGAAAWGAPHFPPGEGYGYAYSDTGYTLLGLVIEHLDDQPLHRAYRRRILEPLGMASTYLEGYEDHRGSPIAHTYQGPIDTMPMHGSADWAGGGLVSTVDDLVTFGHALAADRLLPSEWGEVLLHHEFRTLDPERHTPGFIGYGCGVEARLSRGRLFRGHRGHWGALLHVEPASGLVITGSTNDATARPDDLFHDVVAIADRHGLLEQAAPENRRDP